MTDLKFIEIAKLVLFSEIQSTLALSIIVKEMVSSIIMNQQLPKQTYISSFWFCYI